MSDIVISSAGFNILYNARKTSASQRVRRQVSLQSGKTFKLHLPHIVLALLLLVGLLDHWNV